MGVTGSGKSYQWLKLAEALLPTGAIFRCIDTDNDIMYMLMTQFPKLLPQNGGNVYVHPAFDWPEYEHSVKWITHKLTTDHVNQLDKYMRYAYDKPIVPDDWVVSDKINNAWKSVTRHFVTEVFGDDMGEYFLQIRKELRARGDKMLKDSSKAATSTITEGLDGWKDWSVINKLYEDWILPIIYRVNCHVYAATDVDKLSRDEKDVEIVQLFGGYGIRPDGQKALGGQHHSIFLFIPGKDKWFISTIKDRAGRPYFSKTPLTSFYRQYLIAKCGWEL
jgi:hypothetical protein